MDSMRKRVFTRDFIKVIQCIASDTCEEHEKQASFKALFDKYPELLGEDEDV